MPRDKRAELAREQARITRMYDRLDVLRERSREQLAEVRRRGAGGTHQARSERDAFATYYEDRLARLSAVEAGLCFGRLDLAEGERHYVGRIGLSDDEQRVLLVDWRAPAAQPFYRATAGDPQGVRRRRHLRTRARAVVDLDDDVFDFDGLTEEDRSTLGGDAALLAALTAQRTGRMRDIVATIQAQQDEVIRADSAGVLVVEGGPGTGKTAVALHRAAYLLYVERERLERAGVLVVGPSAVFLHYIEAVLPSLGETGVVLSTVESLLPGLVPTAQDPPAAARLKGDLRMADALAAVVAGHQRVPDDELTVAFEEHELVLTPAVCAAARARVRRSRRAHNRGRYAFARGLLAELTRQAAVAAGDPGLAGARWLPRALMRTEEFRAAVDALWPRLEPAEVVRALLGTDAALAQAAPWLGPGDRALLVRRPDAPWTPADVALVDEARALVGDPEEMLRVAQERRRRAAERAYAAEVLELTGTAGRLSAARFAERHSAQGAGASVAERAGGDPDWQYGHVIVDEAQELSPMAWRMLARRCPSRSMTVVGDLAQRSAAAGARAWAEVLDPFAAGRWRSVELSVNYRTPAEVMSVAAQVLRAVDPAAVPPESVREQGEWPRAVQVRPEELLAAAARCARELLERVGGGTVGVLLAPGRHRLSAAALVAAAGRGWTGADGADDPLAVLAVPAAKGLEFDAVLLVEPAEIAEPDGGLRDLYVAVTRATRLLWAVHAQPLPPALAGLHRSPEPV